MTSIKFTDCVIPGRYSTPGLQASAAFDRYFSFSGRVYKVIHQKTNGYYEVDLSLENPNIPLNILKVVSYLTGIIPLIMFVGKFICRTKYYFISPFPKISKINKSYDSPLKFRWFEGFNALQAVNWLINHPDCKTLEKANFSYYTDFDNECFRKLTEHCPNMKHLNLSKTNISGEALQYLIHTKKLQHLNIASCEKLEPDALKHLENTPDLLSLNLFLCKQLEADALKHLKKIPQLQDLNITSCKQFEPDALKNLENVPKLKKLDMSFCEQLEVDALKHLKHTPNLLSLLLDFCNQLEFDALKHLKNTPHLLNLSIESCKMLESDALKHLENTPELHSLDIGFCKQLEVDALKHLKYTPKLKTLKSLECHQFF